MMSEGTGVRKEESTHQSQIRWDLFNQAESIGNST